MGCGDLEWTRMQARMGDAEAEADLGRRYEQGDGVSRNPVRAASWYRRAAKNGNALEHASKELVGVRETMLTAVAKNSRALECASRRSRVTARSCSRLSR